MRDDITDFKPGHVARSRFVNTGNQYTLNLQTGVNLQLSIGGKNQLIRLTKLVEFSSAFARYHFEFVKTDDEETGDEMRPGDEFDDLWNNL